ncbi:GNAT family N-acetyltransferase [Protaetiibacter larvae]|uniref:GNAT family N-acetyltransferase n=1 Tax=Protaetiibacter larvae TaxID=2592654 RepID=A0A5C1Y982_9MICO|nr:GNAT family N-acetyltransferase [Protaetiibacter larvae]QEO10336.1 GNAT family N-acetyltransferase [Protaetiibacter larvae]
MSGEIRVVPANQVSWDQLQTVFLQGGEAAACQCRWFRVTGREYSEMPREERAARLREEAACGHPDARTTSGIVAFIDDEPVGWCAVGPRTSYPRLATLRVPWTGRAEDRGDADVWAVVCFAVRAGFRRRGVSGALAAASVDFARERGARAIEGYPKQLAPGKEEVWGELFVGTPSIFAAAGFREVSHPTLRRSVMRRELD